MIKMINFINFVLAFRLVRADLYSYKYTILNSTSWWERKYVAQYLPPVSVEQLKAYINDLGWDLSKFNTEL